MREILFKAKRIDNGGWVNGYLIQKNDVDAACISKSYIIDKYEFTISTDYNTRFIDLEPIEIDPETICEFTGLKDKKGKMIFEKDIVIQKHRLNQGKETVKGVIVFGKNAQFLIRHKIQKGFDKDKIRNYSIWADCEVIGNKFDLEVGEC